MEIVGIVSNITFRSEDTGYTVVRLNDGIIAVGSMPFVAVSGDGRDNGCRRCKASHGS
ncbi:hypothetical protein AGMMS50268_18780 [Spirochaetia bacterium]|nr:hypothetical protein AGMMS50268_18780 [Spirochaetia bacterium]